MNKKNLGIYPEKATTLKDTCAPIFISALFTITRTWKQPRFPLIDEWVEKMWYIYMMECYSSIKKKKQKKQISVSFIKCVNLQPVVQSGVNQKEKNKYIIMHAAKSLQSCPTLCDPIDGSPPGSPVPGILQARTLEWVAIFFSNA